MVVGCSGLGQCYHNGFKVGPNDCAPTADVAESWIEANDPHLLGGEHDNACWWTAFGDPTLDQLIAQASQQNLTLKIAGCRILEARAERGIAEGNLFPQQQGNDGAMLPQCDQRKPTSHSWIPSVPWYNSRMSWPRAEVRSAPILVTKTWRPWKRPWSRVKESIRGQPRELRIGGGATVKRPRCLRPWRHANVTNESNLPAVALRAASTVRLDAETRQPLFYQIERRTLNMIRQPTFGEGAFSTLGTAYSPRTKGNSCLPSLAQRLQ